MSLVIPDEILQATRMSASELRQEIAVLLFQKEKLTLGQASRLAEMNQLAFQHLLDSRRLPVHYDVAESEEGLRTLAANPVFDFLKEPEEDIYTLADGIPFNDQK